MRAAAAAALLLMLGSSRLSYCCVKEGSTLICYDFPAYFDAGFTSLVFFRKVGEINSTMFHSENLTSVTRFRLEDSDVAVIADGAFRSLRSLRTLSLNGNMLTKVSPSWLGAPGMLTELNFTGNHLEAVTEPMLDGLVNLSKLRLNGNKITSIDVNSLTSLRLLTELDLSENMMTRLSPQVFGSLTSTKIRLDGNPWDCSCGAEQFVSFLKELQSRGLLERHMEVKCGSPPSLSGQPVLNVSVCESSPPPGSPSATRPPPPKHTSAPATVPADTEKDWTRLPTRAASEAGTSVNPKPGDPTMTSSPHTGSDLSLQPEPSTFPGSASRPSEAASCPSQPQTKTVCTLAVVIGLLCLLLLLLAVLAVMRRKKRDIKPVMPSRPREERKNLEEESRSTSCPGGSEEAEGTRERSFRLVRAKSAHAVILTSPFCPANQVTFQVEIESKDGQNPEEKNQTAGIMIREQLTSFTDMKTQCEEQDGEKLHSVFPHSDMVPYLSIGTHPGNQQPSEGPSAGVQGAKVMGRVSTWPPTAAQWRARCKLKEHEDVVTFWTLHRNEKLSDEVKESENDRFKTPSSTETDPQSDSRAEEQENQDMNQEMNQDVIQNQTAMIPFVFETDAQSNSVLKGLEKNQNQETPATETSRTRRPDLEKPGKTTDMNPEHRSGQSNSKAVPRRKAKPSGATRQRKGNRAAGSQAPPGGASPDDETLLSGNEYVCMDLLHEVVQNNGRWTRDRWKQVHANKQRR